jgi:hypothetical protein
VLQIDSVEYAVQVAGDTHNASVVIDASEQTPLTLQDGPKIVPE